MYFSLIFGSIPRNNFRRFLTTALSALLLVLLCLWLLRPRASGQENMPVLTQTTASYTTVETAPPVRIAAAQSDSGTDSPTHLPHTESNVAGLEQPDAGASAGLENFAGWFSRDGDYTTSVAWGDMDGDGDLDLAVGNGDFYPPQHANGKANKVYLNEGGVLQNTAFWTSDDSDATTSVAWGDMDGDGDLDLAVGNTGRDGEANKVYLNEGGVLQNTAFWTSDDADVTTSLAWGDMDGDGDLDLAVGNGTLWGRKGDANKVYRNEGGVLQKTAFWVSDDADLTTSVAWGDMDGDGDLDLAVGNYAKEEGRLGANKIYRNGGNGLQNPATWLSEDSGNSTSVAWGDVDGDGDLDLAVGRDDGDCDPGFCHEGDANKVYLNNEDGLQNSAAWTSDDSDETTSVAWGDMDNDGDLDLAVGNGDDYWDVGETNKVYRNEGGVLQKTAIWESDDADVTTSVAWGDMDGDGDLDLAVGNDGEANKVYVNERGSLQTVAIWESDDADVTTSVAWGDMDGDGDLDLAVGNNGKNKVYKNDGDIWQAEATWSSFDADETTSVAWGDMDGDGDLDLAVGNGDFYGGNGDANKVYLNEGGVLQAEAIWRSSDADVTTSLAWGDMDGDGDLDLTVANYGQNKIYLNNGDGLQNAATWTSDYADSHTVAWGDMDGDGDLDLAVGNWGQSRVYRNTLQGDQLTANDLPTLHIVPPLPAVADFYATPQVLSGIIPISYRLFDPEGDPVGRVAAFYSMDGGGSWRPAVATDTITTNLASATVEAVTIDEGRSFTHHVYLPLIALSSARSLPLVPVNHIYKWDTARSGFFGQSDNVVLRLIAYSQPPADHVSDSGTYRYPNSAVGPIQRPFVSTVTFPFRVRGTQVRVADDEKAPVSDALIYRLLAGRASGATLMPDPDQPLRTDQNGYLRGRGQLAIGDRLVAVTPAISSTNPITFSDDIARYQTSAAPTISGLDFFTVTDSGVQTLTIPSIQAPKLLLANLDVALEWDARNDHQFVDQLRFDIERTSQLLYDWTDGQMALGQVRIYHDAPRVPEADDGFQPWVDGHVRVYATNSMRPSAAQGGIVSPSKSVSETVTVSGGDGVVRTKLIEYGAGQVYMGAVWNRYGEANGSLGEDWPRALAHELGHYLLFLEDNYLSLNAQGILVTVPADECPGAMNDPYRDASSEFQPEGGWSAPGCEQTLSQQELGRTDWETIRKRYPGLVAPAQFNQNPGPSTVPLILTDVTFVAPDNPPLTRDVPIFHLINEHGGTYIPAQGARAFVFQDQRLIDLGQPVLDQVQGWGVRSGLDDRICIYAESDGVLGCELVRAQDDQVTMKAVPGRDPWQPDIRITPVSSRTITVEVLGVAPGVRLGARLYPVDDSAGECILLTEESDHYVGAFPEMAEPILDGYIHLWQEDAKGDACSQPAEGAQRESITSYNIGGNPVHRRSRGVHRRSRGVHRRSRGAPAMSSDGQVILFGETLERNLDEEWFITLQETNSVGILPPGRTLVGQGYRLSASPNAPDMTAGNGASISFGYLGAQVPPGEEAFLRIYFHADDDERCRANPGACWQPLATALETDVNLASARAQGPGLYALMSSIEVGLQPGWNNIAYPVQSSQPISRALASIADDYTVVYHYDTGAENVEDQWQVHGSPNTVPDWVSDLRQLDFGQGYMIHISATQPITLYYGGVEHAPEIRVREANIAVPGTYYVATDAALSSLEALVGGNQCGVGVRVPGGESAFRYRIKVLSDDGANFDGCGAPGRTVSFSVNGAPSGVALPWDNKQVQVLPLPIVATASSPPLSDRNNSRAEEDGQLQKFFLPLIAAGD